VEITISLLTAYAAYLPAEQLDLSGVVAAVTVGLYMGSQTSRVTNAQVRLQGFATWEILTFLLNSFLFVLIGLQLPQLLDELREADYEVASVIGYGLLTSAVVVVARIVWVYGFTYLPGGLAGRREVRAGNTALIAWMGMRGAVSLAAALALPTATDAGEPFTERPLILFITFCVILFTLVVQGLTLPLAVRWLADDEDDREEYEENHARKRVARAAIDRLDELGEEDWTRDDTIERVRGVYEFRQRRIKVRAGKLEDEEGIEDRSLAYQRLMHELYRVQRRAVVELRNGGEISNDVMHRIERELDLEESRLEV
jgi:monovalent cation/hydrogen antiporter